jgi:hypothetical protein
VHNRDKTCCPSGHEYSEENTQYTGPVHGRLCRICHRKRMNDLRDRRFPNARRRVRKDDHEG